jgi:Zn-dependent peptidase ImmA (M78 family)
MSGSIPRAARRYHFTLGHEVGHWRLHRHLPLWMMQDELELSGGKSDPRAAVCSGLDVIVQHAPVEWQANTYAAFLLMPRERVGRAWGRQFNSDRPRVFSAERNQPEIREVLERARAMRRPGIQQRADFDIYVDHVAGLFNVAFGVSRQAMGIQLQTLGFLLAEPPIQRELF